MNINEFEFSVFVTFINNRDEVDLITELNKEFYVWDFYCIDDFKQNELYAIISEDQCFLDWIE